MKIIPHAASRGSTEMSISTVTLEPEKGRTDDTLETTAIDAGTSCSPAGHPLRC